MVAVCRCRQSDFGPAVRLVWDLFAKSVLPVATPEGVDRWSHLLTPRGPRKERLRRHYNRETIAFVAVQGPRIVGVVMGAKANSRGSSWRSVFRAEAVTRERRD